MSIISLKSVSDERKETDMCSNDYIPEIIVHSVEVLSMTRSVFLSKVLTEFPDILRTGQSDIDSLKASSNRQLVTE